MQRTGWRESGSLMMSLNIKFNDSLQSYKIKSKNICPTIEKTVPVCYI